MAKRKKQGGPAFNPVSFNVENIQRAMGEADDEQQPDGDQPSREVADAPARQDDSTSAAEVPPRPQTSPPLAEPASDGTPEPAAESPPPALVVASRNSQAAKPAARPSPTPPPRVGRTPVKRRRPEPAKKGKTLAAAAAARQNRDLYKVDYLRVFVDAQQRRDLGRFVMDLNDALDVRLPETIIYRALLSIMQSAQGHILAAAQNGEPLPATPARQDRLQMAEAEYRVAQLLRDGILAAAEEDLDALYHGRLEADGDEGEYEDDEAYAAA